MKRKIYFLLSLLILVFCSIYTTNQIVTNTTGISINAGGTGRETIRVYYDNKSLGPYFFEDNYSEIKNLPNDPTRSIFVKLSPDRLDKVRIDFDGADTISIKQIQIKAGPFVIYSLKPDDILRFFILKETLGYHIENGKLVLLATDTDPYFYNDNIDLTRLSICLRIYKLFLFIACTIFFMWVFQRIKYVIAQIECIGKKRLFREIGSGIILSAAVCFMHFIYAPFELYFTNQSDFWFDIYTLLPISISVFLIAFFISIVLFIYFYVRGGRQYKITLILYSIFLICSYIQGNFLLSGLPPLDGTNINWNQYQSARLLSIVLWITVSIGIIVLFKLANFSKVKRGVKVISIYMLLMLAISLTIMGITTEGYQKKGILASTTKNEFEMSKNSNFIILVLDAIDASTFSDVVNANPEYEIQFQDFTYYTNTVGAYPFTKFSIPFILSGDWYENDEPFNEYLTKAIHDSNLLNVLEQKNYKMGIYDQDLNIDISEDVDRFDNLVAIKNEIRSYSQFAWLMVQMGGIKYAPFDLKRFCYDSPRRFNELRTLPKESEYSLFSWSNIDFFNDIPKNDIAITEDNCFKFIHLEGGHVPHRYDKNLNIIENGTYEGNIEASMTLVQSYLEMLKRNEVYDNSVIVIMADHGYDQLNGSQGRQNPILLIKGINEKHEMKKSYAPISYDDLQIAYKRLVYGKNSGEVFDYQYGDFRERRYLFYNYEEDDHMTEFLQTGEANDLNTLIPTGREFNLKSKK
ncbi:sulfatase-like hydrolase/transferase [Hungatella sp. L12]|uniref:Sulfatase-like hydrolase/transferase n=1 Tax=Hungatella hominis TaxID=2763050 RepID=A0ABR7HA90_9FIRM|nr:sulfatase-like hydrolase/transferase [Hungatella hominis]MBC5710067.1 sulfatase-like hydrolase/transferase [Hungatella hominis]